MGKLISDKLESETLQPITYNPTTINHFKDNTKLTLEELEDGQNIIFDNGVIEKCQGFEMVNSDWPTTPVTGLHRAYSKTTYKKTLRICNGILKSDTGGAFNHTLLSGLSPTVPTSFVNVKGKAWGVNQTDGIIRYDPSLDITATSSPALLTNIHCPYMRKKIVFFENDETWAGNGVISYDVARLEEWEGNSISSIKLSPGASATINATCYLGYTLLDLSKFPNGKLTTDEDLICFYTFHDKWLNIDYVKIEFSSIDNLFTKRFEAEVKQYKFPNKDFEWNKWEIKKGAFKSVGTTPNWNDIKAVRVTAVASASGALNVNFDYVHMKSCKPYAVVLNKKIFDCEENNNETWSNDASYSFVKAYDGIRCVSVVGSAGGSARTFTCTLGAALDLTKWPDNFSSPVTDEIVFNIFTNDETALTNASCLTLQMGHSSGNYFTYTWATKAALGLVGSNQWFEVRIQKDVVDTAAPTGTPNWNNISWIQLVTSTLTGTDKYLYIDNMRMEPLKQYKRIATFDTPISGTGFELWSATEGYGGQSTSVNGVTVGSHCLKLHSENSANFARSACVATKATLNGGSDINLTVWPDASASGTDDYITFDLTVMTKQYVEYVEIWIDNNSASSFANSYKYRLYPDDYPGITEYGLGVSRPGHEHYVTYTRNKGKVKIKKENFEKIGSSGAWSTVGAVKFVMSAKGSSVQFSNNPMEPGEQMAGAVYIDNLTMIRKVGIEGRYYYKYCYMVNDVPSGFSEISEACDTDSRAIYVSNITTAGTTGYGDARVTARKVYRLGGGYSDTWMLVKQINDNTTTFFVDDVEDASLIESEGNDIPKGDIHPTRGGTRATNLVYSPESDTMLYWGDPDNKNRIYESHPAYYYAVDADGYREFPDYVMSVVPWYGSYIIFYKNRIQKISGDLMTGDLTDIPSNFGACSYWATVSIRTGIVVVGLDNVYLFNGYQGVPIGEEVKSYFKGRESYLSNVNIAYNKENIYIACPDRTGAPSYNNILLRYHMPTKSWSTIGIYVTKFTNCDLLDDTNKLYCGTNTGNVYSLDSSIYNFGTASITSILSSGWLNSTDSELGISKIEFKAKGENNIIFNGYKNFNTALSVCQSQINLTTDWVTYTIGPKNIFNVMKGDNLKIRFIHSNSGYFKIKDIVIYAEKLSKRTVLNDKEVIA